MDCYGDSSCAQSCTRTFMNCIDNCPCHANCYDGCPCENSNFCESRCHDKFLDEYSSCQNGLRRILIHCEEECGAFNPDCEHQCFEEYESSMEDCPCMDNCPGRSCIFVHFSVSLQLILLIININSI